MAPKGRGRPAAGEPAAAPGSRAAASASVPSWESLAAGPLLLVESSPGARARLQAVLAASGFEVTGVPGAPECEAAAGEAAFAYALVNLRLGNGCGLPLVRKLRERHQAAMRIVVVTDTDSFASVILALRAGADDYVAWPAGDGELVDALLGRAPEMPPVPETPLGLSRTCWEHVMRIYEQCGRNVTVAARRLGMHRRSLQRLLSKRAPVPRSATPRHGKGSAAAARIGALKRKGDH
jgi:two-component system, response regulator RegA